MKRQLKAFMVVLLALSGLIALPVQAKSDLVSLCFSGDSNCYLYGRNGIGIIIDAGVDARSVMPYVNKYGLKIKYIIITHGHWDHMSHVEELKNATQAKVILHKDDINLAEKEHPGFKPDLLVKGGETIKAGDMNLEIIHTPGHSPGSICIKEGNMLFTGDTLFKLSIGRTDFEGGNLQEMKASLVKLMQLDDDLTVCPGHDETTTIGFEREHNPYLQGL